MPMSFVKSLLRPNVALSQLKYLSAWKKSFMPGRSSLIDGLPWITFHAIDLLRYKITSTSRIFIYGGSGASIFFLNSGGEVVTVEHDEAQFALLNKRLGAHPKRSNWQGHLITPQVTSSSTQSNPTEPTHYCSADSAFRGLQFQQYVSFIDQFPDSYFDIVFVDGRSRPSCIAHAMSKLTILGWLVIDNSDRGHYFEKLQCCFHEQMHLVLNAEGPVPYMVPFGKTGIWERHKSS